MHGELITGLPGAEAQWGAWDALAVASGRPYAAPAWQLGWWRRAAPPGASPLIVLARDGESVAGVLALYRRPGRTGVERLRIMGAPMAQGTGPVVVRGREEHVARAFAQALAGVRGPRPATLELEGVLDGGRWAGLLAAAWPGRGAPVLRWDQRVPAPLVSLHGGSAEDWLAQRSANFRAQLRRSRRGLQARGASFRRVDRGPELHEALVALVRLHHERWSARGGSSAIAPATGAVLLEVALALEGSGRMSVELIELDGRAISAHLFLAAGEETTYWLGGFDERLAAERPGLVALLQGLEHALERGAARFDLGPGDAAYKRRFADAERSLDWLTLLLPGPRRPLTRLQLAPRRLARGGLERLGEQRAGSLRRVLRGRS